LGNGKDGTSISSILVLPGSSRLERISIPDLFVIILLEEISFYLTLLELANIYSNT
jgi:hypothetical protein